MSKPLESIPEEKDQISEAPLEEIEEVEVEVTEIPVDEFFDLREKVMLEESCTQEEAEQILLEEGLVCGS